MSCASYSFIIIIIRGIIYACVCILLFHPKTFWKGKKKHYLCASQSINHAILPTRDTYTHYLCVKIIIIIYAYNNIRYSPQ